MDDEGEREISRSYEFINEKKSLKNDCSHRIEGMRNALLSYHEKGKHNSSSIKDRQDKT